MRSFSNVAVIAILVVLFSAWGCEQTVEPTTNGGALSKGRGLGVCFMGGQSCMDIYVDNGEYKAFERHEEGGKRAAGIPVYVFPSIQADRGGRPHPLDPNKRYRPYRLQNNVFARPGRDWEMWLVKSGTLNLMAVPMQGVVLWGVGADTTAGGDIKDPSTRDLFASPFRSEAEILNFASQGLVRIENTEMIVDCPITTPGPNDEVVNLNPGFPICGQ